MSFFAKLEEKVKAMWHKLPSLEVRIASAVNSAVPVIEKLDEIADPAEAAIINPIMDRVKTGLTALSVTIQGAGDHATVRSIIGSVASHITALEQAAEIKSADTKQKIAAVVAVVGGEMAAIGSALPTA